MTTKISCLEKPRFLTRNPPNSKSPIKTVFKTASLQFRGGSFPNVVQTAKAARRKPTKNTAAVKNKNSKACFQTLSWSDNTVFGGMHSKGFSCIGLDVRP